MKIIILFFVLLSTLVNAEDIHTTCERTITEQILKPYRIPDEQLPPFKKIPQFKSPDIKSGQCLHHVSTGKCNIQGVNNTTIFLSNGFTASEWNQKYPNQSPPSTESYCRNCNDLNSGTPEYGTISSYGGIFTGYKYIGCQDKTNTTNNTNNFDGCYSFTIEEQQKIETYPCTIYICKETDIVPGHFLVDTANLYSCQVKCSSFNNAPSTWDYVRKAYVCLPPPIDEPDPEPEEGCDKNKADAWGCLKEDTQDIVNETNWLVEDYFQILFTKLNDFFNQSDEEEEESNEPDYPPSPDNSTLPNAELPILENEFSTSDLLENIFPTNVICPIDKTLNLLDNDYTFSFSKLCEILAHLGNIVMALSIYAAFRIVRY